MKMLYAHAKKSDGQLRVSQKPAMDQSWVPGLVNSPKQRWKNPPCSMDKSTINPHVQ